MWCPIVGAPVQCWLITLSKETLLGRSWNVGISLLSKKKTELSSIHDLHSDRKYPVLIVPFLPVTDKPTQSVGWSQVLTQSALLKRDYDRLLSLLCSLLETTFFARGFPATTINVWLLCYAILLRCKNNPFFSKLKGKKKFVVGSCLLWYLGL